MGYIKLEKIIVHNGKLTYSFSSSEDINQFFTDTPFEIEYPENISNVPKSVLTIPFVCNVLPIIWLTDSTLFLEEIDKAFFESIPKFKQGYINMYPNARFGGEIVVKNIVDNSYSDIGKTAMFYSGGLDSTSTLVSHVDEKPVLLSVWGSDIKYNNESGWRMVHSAIKEASDKFGLQEAVFRSTFREFDNEVVLDRTFSEILGDGWWHGIKHSLALLGHIAPYTYKHQISKMYISASNCAEYGFRKCASTPEVDNNIRFCSCKVFHDGFELNRQDKVHNIVEFSKKSNQPITLHVCWETQDGNNCCHCEKCYRTIYEFWAECCDPKEFGFKKMDFFVSQSRQFYVDAIKHSDLPRLYFPETKSKARENREVLKSLPYYNDFKWILKTNFDNTESIKMPLSYRIRNRLSGLSFYQSLHKVKYKLKGNK